MAVRAVSTLRGRVAKNSRESEVAQLKRARLTVLKWAQLEEFGEELDCLRQGREIPQTSRLIKLDPFIHADGLLRVGGRLKNADLLFEQVHPIILPRRCHTTKLVIDACHKAVKHQGRGITVAETRSSGYWITGCNNAVSAHIHNCVTCRRLRHPTASQQMVNLPIERVSVATPFTYVGCDDKNRQECPQFNVVCLQG